MKSPNGPIVKPPTIVLARRSRFQPPERHLGWPEAHAPCPSAFGRASCHERGKGRTLPWRWRSYVRRGDTPRGATHRAARSPHRRRRDGGSRDRPNGAFAGCRTSPTPGSRRSRARRVLYSALGARSGIFAISALNMIATASMSVCQSVICAAVMSFTIARHAWRRCAKLISPWKRSLSRRRSR